MKARLLLFALAALLVGCASGGGDGPGETVPGPPAPKGGTASPGGGPPPAPAGATKGG